jgi:hypothetical protein
MKNVQFDIAPELMRQMLHLPERCEVLRMDTILEGLTNRILVRAIVRDPELPDSDQIHVGCPTFTTTNEYRPETYWHDGSELVIDVPRPATRLKDWGIRPGT